MRESTLFMKQSQGFYALIHWHYQSQKRNIFVAYQVNSIIHAYKFLLCLCFVDM